jgi:hypothetical protein
MMWLVACALPEPIEVVQLDRVDVIKLPHWQIEAASVDPQCSGLTDYCVETRCTVRSLEKVASEAEIVFTLDQRDGRYVERRPLALDALDVQEVTHRFTEARLLGGQAHGRCDLVQNGTRVTCRLVNTGQQEHRLVVAAQLVDELGNPSAEDQATVDLAAGEAREVRFVFDKQNVSGQCEIR